MKYTDEWGVHYAVCSVPCAEYEVKCVMFCVLYIVSCEGISVQCSVKYERFSVMYVLVWSVL